MQEAGATSTGNEETPLSRLEAMWGAEGLERAQNSTVMVLGVGGVGSNCIEALARGGVGTLIIVDGDAVAASNINRQAIAFTSTVGKRKVDVMAGMIRDINPACTVIAHGAFVLPENLEGLFDECLAACSGRIDYIVDAIDTVSAKLALAQLADERGVPLISSMGAANKLHPECLRICDIRETERDPLARVMRKECRRRGIHRLQVLYSCEDPIDLSARGQGQPGERVLGTASFMPPIMGQMIAGEVIRQISGVGCGRARAGGARRDR